MMQSAPSRAADAAVLAAQANVREAQINLSYTRVVAPISGIAGRAVQSEGSLAYCGDAIEPADDSSRNRPDMGAIRGVGAGVRRVAHRGRARCIDAVGRVASTPTASRIRRRGASISLARRSIRPSGRCSFAPSSPIPELAMLPGEYLRVRLSGGKRPVRSRAAEGSAAERARALRLDRERRRAGGADGKCRRALGSGTSGKFAPVWPRARLLIVDNLQKLKAGRPVHVQTTRMSEARDRRDDAGSQATAAASMPRKRG